MSAFYKYYSEVGLLSEIEDYIRVVDNDYYNGEPVKFSTSENTDVFSVAAIDNNSEIIQIFKEKDLAINDIEKLSFICNRKFWKINNKDYAIIYNNADNTGALLTLLHRVSLSEYKQVFVKLYDKDLGIWRTIEF